MSFREAQLAVLGSKPKNIEWEDLSVELNNEQVFPIGDVADVVGIRLDSPHILVQVADGPQSWCHIDNFSDKVIDECVEILRGIAAYYDWHNHKDNLEAIKSKNNPRA